MVPVQQTETAPGKGNCLAACIASLLAIPISQVPNFRLAYDPWTATQKWLAARGLFLVRVKMSPGCLYPVPFTYCILTGQSPRRPVGHAVIGTIEGDEWRIIHDPHPDGTGLAGAPEWIIFLGALQHSARSDRRGGSPCSNPTSPVDSKASAGSCKSG